VLLLLRVEVTLSKGKQSPKAEKDRKFIIEAHFVSRKSLM